MIRYGELRYISKNVVEVGMFNPKSGSDNDILVVNFFVKEESVLNSISTFIEYMTLNTYIATSHSNYIDDDGFYMIFIELEKNKNTYNDFLKLVKQMSNLTLYTNWDINVYKKKPHNIKVDKIIETITNEKHNK